MRVDLAQMRRLRTLAAEPQRGTMPRTRPWPSTDGRFIDQKLEIQELRKALREAIALIDVFEAEDEARRQEAMEMSEWE